MRIAVATALLVAAVSTLGTEPSDAARSPHAGAVHLELAALHEPHRAMGDHFGHAVAISAGGTEVLVGAYGASGGRGAAYLFAASAGGWRATPIATFSGPPTPASGYGIAVALSPDGRTAYVGADSARVGGRAAAGAVSVYAWSHGRWPTRPTRVIVDPGAGVDEYFGVAVAVAPDGSAVVIGSPGRRAGGTVDAGAAYVYAASHGVVGPGRPTTLLGPSEGAGLFGFSVAISDDAGGHGVLVVGADGTAIRAQASAGAAYLYDANGRGAFTPAPGGALLDPGRAGGDAFGAAVAVDAAGTLVLVGAQGETARGATAAGSVFAYEQLRGAWARSQTLTGADTRAAGFASPSISADGAVVVAGAPNEPVGHHPAAGAAFVYVRAGATLLPGAEITDPTGGGAGQEYFGAPSALSANGDVSVIGAEATAGTRTGPGPGAAYVFEVAPHPSIRSIAPRRGPAAGGTPVTITGSGLAGATAVRFGTAPVRTLQAGAAGTSITVVSPPHAAGAVRIAVTTPGGTSTSGQTFTYT